MYACVTTTKRNEKKREKCRGDKATSVHPLCRLMGSPENAPVQKHQCEGGASEDIDERKTIRGGSVKANEATEQCDDCEMRNDKQ